MKDKRYSSIIIHHHDFSFFLLAQRIKQTTTGTEEKATEYLERPGGTVRFGTRLKALHMIGKDGGDIAQLSVVQNVDGAP